MIRGDTDTMKRHLSRFGGLRLCIAICLPLLAAGCAGRGSEGQPPAPAQIQEQNRTLMNDPHVPDSIKQHLKEQQEANQATARGYTAERQGKPTGNK